MPEATEKYEQQNVNFLGLNLSENRQAGELADSKGLSTANYPCITQRKGRTAVEGYSAPTDMFEWDGHRVVIDGTQLLYDRAVLCQVQAGKKQFAVVNTKMIVWPDKIMIDMTNGTYQRMDEQIQSNAGAASIVSNAVLNIAPNRLSVNNIVTNSGGNRWYYGLQSAPVWIDDHWESVGEITREVPGIAQTWGFESGDQRLGNALYFIPYKTELGTYAMEEIQYVRWDDYPKIEVPPAPSQFQHTPNLDGVYGKITEIITNTLGYEITLTSYWFSGRIQFKYDLYDAASGTKLLSDYFTVGDFVDISGLNAGDLKTKKILAIDDAQSRLTFDENTFTGTGAQTAAVTVQRNIPALDFICSKNNRLYGVSNSVENRIWNATTQQYEEFNSRCLYVSALGKPMNFWDFEGVDTDSYQVAIGSNGDFTGICAYANAVLCWKENIMHKLMGDYPSEFYLTDYNIAGVQAGSHRAMQIINDVLYYKGANGVFAFSGGTPQLISYKLGTEILTNAVGGSDGAHYYISAQRPNGTWRLLSYDLTHGLWMQEEEEEVDAFAQAAGVFYIMTGGAIYSTGPSEPEVIDWMAEFVPFTEDTLNRKFYTMLRLRVEMSPGSLMFIDTKVDTGKWKQAMRKQATNDLTFSIPLRISRCDRFSVRIRGKGRVTIRTMAREFSAGSEER